MNIIQRKSKKNQVKTMNENKTSKKDILTLLFLETAVAVLIILGYIALDMLGMADFEWRVISGALLGVAVIVLNYLFLTLSVNRAIEGYLALRGDREMDDEEAEKFAAENSMPIQNAIKVSFITRTVTMLGALLIAFLTGWFNPLATAIPLILFRPLLNIMEIIKGKVKK